MRFSQLTEQVEITPGEWKTYKFVDRLGSSIYINCGAELPLSAFYQIKYIPQEEIIMKKVAIIMGSDSDLPVIEKGIAKLEEFGIDFEVHVFSAHRTPVEAKTFSESARENGFGVIIAAAGMAAHLAGAIAANTTLPVIGIPVKSTNLDGMDALLSTVQMPTGIPVATVAINGAANAALLAIEILAVTDSELADKLDKMRKDGAETVLKKDAAISAKYSK